MLSPFLLALSALATSASIAGAQPVNRTLKVVYAYAAGNSGDAVCRITTDRLAARRGHPAIVENRGGASGRIGTRAVIGAAPDGNTLLCSPMAPIVLHPVTHQNLGYDPFVELAPVSQLVTFDIGVTVGPASPARTIAELVTWVKSSPVNGAYGVPGLGGLPHFFAVMFASNAGISLRNVPYTGSGALMNDVLAGQLPIAVVPTADMAELHRNGKVRILASSSVKSSPLLPDVPTFRAAGFDIAGDGWYGIYAPARTPGDIVSGLSADIQAILRDPDVRERISKLGFVPTGTSPKDLADLQNADRALWTPVIRASGFKPTD